MLTVSKSLTQAVEFHQRGDLDRAEQLYRRILEVDARHADAWHLLGLIAHARGNETEALEYIGRAIQLAPQQPSFHNHLSEVYRTLGRLDEAQQSCRQALEIDEGFVAAHNSLGMVYNRQGRYDEAAGSFRRALEIDPNFAVAHANLSMALQGLGRSGEALAAAEQALALEQRATECRKLGTRLRAQGKLTEAAQQFNLAARCQPDSALVRHNRSTLLLLQGDFERGWPEYEWRWQVPGAPRRPQLVGPQWDGDPLEGRTILIYPEQGYGDMLQFVRYAPLVKARGGRVLFGCPENMVPILSTCEGIDEFYTQTDPPPYDTHVALVSLPGVFKTDLNSIPADVPYLSAEPQRVERWGERLADDGSLRVGINWQGEPKLYRQPSIPLVQFEPLAGVPNVRLVSLQYGLGTEQLAGPAEAWPIIDFGDELNASGGAFMDSAAIMQHLDLVITCDTAVAHLAGALGVPVWLALTVSPDWRWLLEPEDSPWYPTMRLFRQTQPGDWPGVFARMAAELRTLAARR